ncbi:MAG: hypothetical protein V4667_08115 [Bacteroidota bacterium]
MIKYCTNIFLVFILLLCYTNTNGYNVPTSQDTTKTHILDELATRKIVLKDYRISLLDFRTIYEFDKQSKRLILNSFIIRGFLLALMIITIPVFIVFMGALLLTAAGGGSSDSFLKKSGIAVGIAIALDIASLIISGLNNKNRLLKKLITYRKQYNFKLYNKKTFSHLLEELAERPAYKKEYKISKRKFKKLYAFDDTSKEIINLYYKRRLLYIFLVSIAEIAAFTMYFFIWVKNRISKPFPFGKINTAFEEELLSLSYSVGFCARIFGIIKLHTSSKHSLLQKLIEYRKQYNLNIQKND